MNRKTLQITLNQAAQVRDRQLQRQVEAQERRELQSVNQGSYVGYDADTGLHSVELEDGSIIQVSTLTTAGLEGGDRVSVSRDGLYGNLKAMPR